MSAIPKHSARRSADQAELSFYVETLLAASQRCLDPEGAPERETPRISVYAPDDMTRLKTLLQDIGGDGSSNARAVLKLLEAHGPRWECSPVPMPSSLDKLKRRFPNFRKLIDEVQRAAALAGLTPGGRLTLPPLLLSGPPGIGKSRIARELSGALRVPMVPFAMTQTTASFSLAGLNSQYSGGGPGDLVRSIAQHGVPDLLVVLDEVDKASTDATHDPLGPLYDLLERDTAKRFVDDGLRMPLDLSAVRWICTCNDADRVPKPLQSRLEHFEIPAPSVEQMHAIVSDTYAELLRDEGWEQLFEPMVPDAVCHALSTKVPRHLDRVLRTALGQAALDKRRRIRVSDLPIVAEDRKRSIGFL